MEASNIYYGVATTGGPRSLQSKSRSKLHVEPLVLVTKVNHRRAPTYPVPSE